jgi:Cd2+/Zn2+-exporting ATPase
MKLLKDRKFVMLLMVVFAVLALETASFFDIIIPMPYSPIVFALFILLIGWKVLWEGVKALFTVRFSSINLLMLMAVCAAFYLQQYTEAAVVIVLYVLGETLEDKSIEESKSALSNLMMKSPKTAMIKGIDTEQPIESIAVGTIIIIKPHELVALDGKIVSGETTIDETTITGEPVPKYKTIGEVVFAGTLNQNGYIEVQTTKLAAETTLEKIINLTFAAQENRSKNQKTIQTFTKYYTPSIFFLSLLLFVIPVFALHQDLNHWLLQAISLLVIACPCALVISSQVAVFAAISNASSRGILVKGGKYIEIMAKIKAIAFDKTRTITQGTPEVSDVITFNGTTREELLACASGTELFSEHPVAQAIVNFSQKEGFKPHPSDKFQSIAGKGATAHCLVCKHEDVLIGQLQFIGNQRTVSDEAKQIVKQLSDEGKTSVVISFDDGIAGVIGITDRIKPESSIAFSQLKALKIIPIMLSGDNPAAAKYVAEKVGISESYGGLLPEEKEQKIQELKQIYGTVAMVGDGVNDTPALAGASVGIAMAAMGSDSAIEIANIALMNDKITLIPFLVRLGKATVRNIKWNIILAIAVKLVFIFLAILGHTRLVLAIGADVGVTLIVIFWSLTLMRFESNRQT